MRAWMLLVLGLLLARPSFAQEHDVRVEVVVTAVSGGEVYLNRGSDEGLRVGDRVELLPDAGARLIGTIRSLSRASSRATFDGGVSGVPIGTRGEVLVPADRERDTAAIEWSHPPLEWNDETPLLAPVASRPPEERDMRVRGRSYLSYDTSDDRENDQRFTSARGGIDLEFENPFARGGRLAIDLDYFARDVELSGGSDDSDTRFRVDRLSYRHGVLRGRSSGYEVGRFLHGTFPELGVIDGFEYTRRLASGNVVGASAGFLPLPSDEMRTGDDLAASAFYRYVSGEEERLVLGAALQKTWHKGAADRDLLVGTVDFHPSSQSLVYATALVDYYTSGDDLKTSTLELTQLHAGANWRFYGGHGVGGFVSHLKWPDVDREEFSVPDATVRDGFVTRVGTNAWVATSKRTRVDARIAKWNDESDADGGDGSLRLTLRDVLYARGTVTLEAFANTGEFSDSSGFRVAASRRFTSGFLRVDWSSTELDQEDFIGGQRVLGRDSVRASYDWDVAPGWGFSAYVESITGDEQDARGLGFNLQRYW